MDSGHSEQSTYKFGEPVNDRAGFERFRSAMLDAPFEEAADYFRSMVHEGRGDYNQLYRVYSGDLEGDLVFLMRRLVTDDATGPEEHRYRLQRLWRFLMRRYAFHEAFAVGGMLRMMGEDWPWGLWRSGNYLLPRLILALGLARVAMMGSSGLDNVLVGIAQSGGGAVWGAVVVFGAAAFVLGALDVQTRVSRRVGPWIRRSLLVFGMGASYTILLFGLSMAGYALLGAKQGWELGVVRAMAGWPLAFVIQLFWREQSVGDPL